MSRSAPEKKPSRAPATPRVQPSDPRLQTGIVAALALLALLKVSVAFAGPGSLRLWGLDAASFLADRWDVVAALLLPFAALLPPVRDLVARAVSPRGGAGKGVAFAIVMLLALAGAALLAISTPVAFAFLGDGSYYVGEVYRASVTPGYQPAFVKPTAWLTGRVLQWIAVTFPAETTRAPFIALGLAGLAPLLTGFFLFLRGERTEMRWLLAVFLLFTAGSLFFFGYIELYALSYACGAVYFLAVWAVFRSGASPWPAGVALLAAVAFGLSAAVFVPSWLLVLHWKFRGESGPFPLKRAAAALCVLSVLVFVAAYVVTGAANEEMQLMPLAPFQKTTGGVPGGWQQYTLFSRAHLVDMLNALLLVAGPALAVCVAALAVARRASAWRDPAVLTGLVAAVGGVLFVFFGHARLGLARDWDLAALPLLGLAFLAASLLAALAKEGKIVLAPLLPLLLALALGDTWVWMRVNIDEDASARRLESIVDRDAAVLLPIHTYTALENLRKHYRALRSEDHHVATLKRMIATGYHKPDTYEKFLGVLAQRRSPEERGRDLSWVFERLLAESASMNGPAGYAVVAPRTLRELAAKALLIGAQTGESGRVRDVLPRFRAALEPWKEAGLVEAFVTPGLTPDDVADRVAAAIDSATADAALLIAAARVHRAAARYAAAATLYERAITRDPDGYPESYIALAQICFEQLGDRARSEDALRRCLAQAPGSAEAAEARRILLLMQQQR